MFDVYIRKNMLDCLKSPDLYYADDPEGWEELGDNYVNCNNKNGDSDIHI